MLDTEHRIAPPRSDSPYPGLVPYGDRDAPFFFGREHERGIISANLLASRLTLLYGASGVGKSSVLRAGVVHDLRRQATERIAGGATPEFVVVEFGTWRDDPIAGLEAAVGQSVERTLGEVIPDPPPTTRGLDRFLGTWAERLDTDLLIILDQFEEYFLYHGSSDGEGTFAVEFPRAVNARDLRANFLLSIREDAVAKLDRFKGRIPNLFGNYLRIRHLDRDSGRAAIVKPLEQFNRLIPRTEPVTIEPELVERILDQVGTERVTVGPVGHGAIAETSGDVDRIETPFLQLVVSRLWDEEAEAGSSELRLETLEHLGGAQRIVRTHLDNAMEGKLSAQERDMAARVFRYLVTRSGSKIAHTAADLAYFAEVPEVALCGVLERLAGSDVRIIRTVAPPPGAGAPRYEIFHDVLAAAVLDWRARYEQRRRQAETERRLEREKGEAQEVARKARRRSRTFAALLGAAVLVVLGVLLLSRWALDRRDAARTAAAAAQSDALVAEAVSKLDIDPREGVRLALQAWQEKHTDRAGAVLREALAASHVRAVVSGHDGIVWSAKFSPDGAHVVTASRDGTARIASAASGTTLHVLRGHEEGLTGAAFSPDGKYVVTAGLDGTARVWDASTGDEVGRLPHPDRVFISDADGFDPEGRYVATGPFSRNGRYLATFSGRRAFVWDLTTAEVLHELELRYAVNTAAFSPEGDSVVTASFDGLRIWDVRSGESRSLEAPRFSSPWLAAFSPNGELVATGTGFGSISLRDAETGSRVAKWRPHGFLEVTSVGFSPDSTRLVTAGGNTVKVWDISTQGRPRPKGTAEASSRIREVRFSPDGGYVLSADQEGTAQVWEAATGKELFTLRGHADVLWSAEFSPDGDRVVTASEDGTARVWTVDTGEELRRHSFGVNAVGFSPDGNQVITGGGDSYAYIWETATGEQVHKLRGVFALRAAAFTPEGDRVVIADNFYGIYFSDARTGDRLGTCCRHPQFVALRDAEFSPVLGEDRVLVVYENGSARLWDVTDVSDGGTAQLLRKFGGGEAELSLAAFSPDGDVITVGRFDRTARVWDSATGEEMKAWRIGKTGVLSLGFSPDGSTLVTGGTDRRVRLWNVDTGRQLSESLRGGGGTPVSISFSPDGRWIVAGGSDGAITIWAADSLRLLAVLQVHADFVNSVAVSLDGRIVSGSDDRTAKLYACETCVPMKEIKEMAQSHLLHTDPGD